MEGAGAGIDIPLSALEHFSYCERQCALIHVEQTFDDNAFTARGRLAHERVDTGPATTAPGVRFLRGMTLWSERLGLFGRADLVELRETGPFPVEYKVGALSGGHAAVQLCAQALCLEEMFATSVPGGALYSHATRRRQPVAFDAALRDRTMAAIEGVRRQIERQELPPAADDARCPSCSLINVCLPSVVAQPARLRGYQGALFWPRALEPEDDGDV